MFKLNTVDPKDATGQVAEAYGIFPPQIGVPAPFRLFSASPGYLKVQAAYIKYMIQHPTIDSKLSALIRYSMAAKVGYPFCTAFNGNMLKMFGLSDVDLEGITDNPDSAPLDDKGKALLKFVLKTYSTPEQVTEADIAALRDLGWADSDIMDGLMMAGNMIAPSYLFTALATGQSC